MPELTASGAPMPPPCNSKIFKKGVVVALVYGPSEDIEAWVVELRRLTELPADWHFAGGVGRVLMLLKKEKDIVKVREAIPKLPRDERTNSDKINAQLNRDQNDSYTGSRVTLMSDYSMTLTKEHLS